MKYQPLLTHPFHSIRSWVVFSTAQPRCALGMRPALDVLGAGFIQLLLLEGVLLPLCHLRTVTGGQEPPVWPQLCSQVVSVAHEKGLGFVVPLLTAGTNLARIWGCEWRVNSAQRSTGGFRVSPRGHSLQSHRGRVVSSNKPLT